MRVFVDGSTACHQQGEVAPMKVDRQLRQTELIELVETHNIARSISRIKNAPGWDQNRWRRTLYHALGMSHIDRSIIAKIREALELP